MLKLLFPGVDHLQNIHPLVVHFPIAFLIGSALLYALALLLRRDVLATSALALSDWADSVTTTNKRPMSPADDEPTMK